MPRALVTGATGFVGRNLVEVLRARGETVRCLVRRTANPRSVNALAALGAELVHGDVTDPASLPAAVAGVEVVYHVAGLTLTLRPEEFARVNAEGPRLLAAACAASDNPPILIAVSSLAAAGPSPPQRPRGEDHPPQPVSKYGRSKWQGEVVLHRFADRVPTTIVRPPGVFGPWDTHVLEAFRLVRQGWHLTPGWSSHRVAVVAVSDLVEGLLRAAERGRRLTPGAGPDAAYQGYYFVAHEEQPTFADMGRLIAAALGRRRPFTLKVPGPLCWGVAGIAEVVARWRRRPALFNIDKMREATAGSWVCRIDRARSELGWQPQAPLVEQLRATAQWYIEQGWL
jgi:nucleoside-diphosphate-sugar epimerase